MSGWHWGLVGLVLVSALVSGCQYEASFKRVEFDGVEYDPVFDSSLGIVRRYFNGVMIRSDRDTGQIETDPVEFSTAKGTRREDVFVRLERLSGTRVAVELFARMSELILDPGSDDNPMQWRTLGSDVTQERLMLDDIVGEVLRRYPDAEVDSSG